VVLFPARRRAPPPLPVLARWVSLAAATLLAGWLGFTLGAGTSLSLAQRGQSDGGLFNELLDQPAGFLRDLTDGAQT
jgi:anti-sigma factor RsiW